jgi:hypothetical protein
VNGTFQPTTGYKTAVETLHATSLQLEHHGNLPLTDEMAFPIRAGHDMELGAITLMLDYDPSQIEITGVTMPENGGVEPWFKVQSSKFQVAATLNLEPETLNLLHIGWMSMDPVSVAEGQAVILVHARLRNPVETLHATSLPLADPIRFTLNENPDSEFADGDGNVIDGVKLVMPDAGRNGEMVKWRNGEIVCYPNPVKDLLNVEFVADNVDGETCNGMSLQLVTMQGVVVAKQTVPDIKTGLNKTTMDLRDLPNGAYLLKVLYEDQLEVRKVIVNR